MADEGAPDALRRLAGVAAARPADTPAGGVHYLQTRGWYLTSTEILVGESLRPVDSRLEEVDREVWVAEDGSGQLVEFCDGRLAALSGRYGPGHFAASPQPALDSGEQATGAGTPGRSPLRALVDLWSVRTVAPAEQARALNALASRVGSAPCFSLRDRLGREGLAVAAEEIVLGLAYRYVVVLSERTGALLAAEEVALEPAEWLPEAAPCTVSHTAFVTSGLVPALGMKPGAGPAISYRSQGERAAKPEA